MSKHDHNNDKGGPTLMALLRFMEARGLKAGPLAKRAGFAPSAIYNLTAGRAAEPSSALLRKIADAEGVTVADILAFGSEQEKVVVSNIIVSGGRVLVSNAAVSVTRPRQIDPGLEVDAAEVSGDGLFPVPSGWIVFFETAPRPAADLVGELCVVRARGMGEAIVGTIRNGRAPHEFDVQPWHGPTHQGLAILAAHKVVSLNPPG